MHREAARATTVERPDLVVIDVAREHECWAGTGLQTVELRDRIPGHTTRPGIDRTKLSLKVRRASDRHPADRARRVHAAQGQPVTWIVEMGNEVDRPHGRAL